MDTRGRAGRRPQLGRARPHLRARGNRVPAPCHWAGSGLGCGGAAGERGWRGTGAQRAEPVLMAVTEDDPSAVLDELSRNFTYWEPGPGNGSLSSAWYRRNQVRPAARAPGRSSLGAGPARGSRPQPPPSCQLSARATAALRVGRATCDTATRSSPSLPPHSAELPTPRCSPPHSWASAPHPTPTSPWNLPSPPARI